MYKKEGNDEYRSQNFSNAIHFYTEGIKVKCKDVELNAQLYSNRATAHFRLGENRFSLVYFFTMIIIIRLIRNQCFGEHYIFVIRQSTTGI